MAAKYPHMKASEVVLWDRFLEHVPWAIQSIRYDVRLGEGARLPEGSPEWVKRMAWSLSTKRIDAVVETSHEIIIVELKDRAGLSAVGQLLGYLALYIKQYRPKKPIRLALVCARVAPDMDAILPEYGIETYLV